MGDVRLPPEERLAAQVAASAALEDRIVIPDYGHTRQPYIFFGFVPGSNIMQPWAHQKSRHDSPVPSRQCHVEL